MFVAAARGHRGGKAHRGADGGDECDVRHAFHEGLESFHRVARGDAHHEARDEKQHTGFVTFDEPVDGKNDHCDGKPDLPGHDRISLVG